MNERANTLESQGINKNLFTQICEGLIERRSLGVTRQSIEEGIFAFDYEGESEESFEIHHYPVPGRRGEYHTVRVPICNEHAAPRVGLVDWVNFTFIHLQESSEVAALLVSNMMKEVLGYGITSKRDRGCQA